MNDCGREFPGHLTGQPSAASALIGQQLLNAGRLGPWMQELVLEISALIGRNLLAQGLATPEPAGDGRDVLPVVESSVDFVGVGIEWLGKEALLLGKTNKICFSLGLRVNSQCRCGFSGNIRNLFEEI